MPVEGSPSFHGFQTDDLALIRLPEAFFTQLLPLINDLQHLRLLLYIFWRLEQQESKVRYLQFKDLTSDPLLMQMIGGEKALRQALEGLINLGAVLQAGLEHLDQMLYFINAPQGRAAVEAISQGEWRSTSETLPPVYLRAEQPNIYQLYEENIGSITPMMAEILKADEADYPASWIEEAIRIAVKRNARNWKYVQAILERWQKEGRGDEKNRRDDSQTPGSYRESWLGKD